MSPVHCCRHRRSFASLTCIVLMLVCRLHRTGVTCSRFLLNGDQCHLQRGMIKPELAIVTLDSKPNLDQEAVSEWNVWIVQYLPVLKWTKSCCNLCSFFVAAYVFGLKLRFNRLGNIWPACGHCKPRLSSMGRGMVKRTMSAATVSLRIRNRAFSFQF